MKYTWLLFSICRPWTTLDSFVEQFVMENRLETYSRHPSDAQSKLKGELSPDISDSWRKSVATKDMSSMNGMVGEGEGADLNKEWRIRIHWKVKGFIFPTCQCDGHREAVFPFSPVAGRSEAGCFDVRRDLRSGQRTDNLLSTERTCRSQRYILSGRLIRADQK